MNERVDIIKRSYSDDTKEYSMVIGVSKSFTFYVYTLPEFVRIYTGTDQKTTEDTFNRYTADYKGETESFI